MSSPAGNELYDLGQVIEAFLGSASSLFIGDGNATVPAPGRTVVRIR